MSSREHVPEYLSASQMWMLIGGMTGKAWRMKHARGETPEPIVIAAGTRKRYLWRRDEVRAWIEAGFRLESPSV